MSNNFTINQGEFCHNNLTSSYSKAFTECLVYFLVDSMTLTIINSLMALITFIANSIVIFLLFRRNNKQTVFDGILLSHAFVDMMTNSIDLPIYHINSIFNYFPFGKGMCFFHLTIDQSSSTIEVIFWNMFFELLNLSFC
jgi:hypothetical protein